MLDDVEKILLIVICTMAILSALLYALHLWIQCHRKLPSVHNLGFSDDSNSSSSSSGGSSGGSQGGILGEKGMTLVETNHRGGAAYSQKQSLLLRVIASVTKSADIDDDADEEDDKQDDFAISICLTQAERAQLLDGRDRRQSRAGSAVSYAEDETDLVPSPIEFRHTRFTPQIRLSNVSRASSSSSAFAYN